MKRTPAETPRFDGSVPAVELRALRKAFRGRDVLRGVDLSVKVGETFSILGGSGSGKSVCLKHMIGLLRPDSGRVSVGGVDITELSERQLVAVRRHFGMVFQGAALFDSLSVYENVAFPLREHLDLPEERIAARVRECLEAVALPGIEPLLPDQLSGGMRKRVGLARAIALEPELILYDEPTTGLDPASAQRIGDVILGVAARSRVTSVVVTHDLELCFRISDRVALLKGGCMVAEGTAAEMRDSPHPDVRAFLEGARDAPPDGGGSVRHPVETRPPRTEIRHGA